MTFFRFLVLIWLQIIFFHFISVASNINTYSPKSFRGFEKNIGQIYDDLGEYREDVHFTANFSGTNIFFTDSGLVLSFRNIKPSEYEMIKSGRKKNTFTDIEWEHIEKGISKGEKVELDIKGKAEIYRIDINFLGAKMNSVVGINKKRETRQYFHPHYPEGISAVPLYEKIRYTNVYEGIDLVFYSESGRLKYDFELAPYADPSQIKILYKGHDNMSIDDNGDLVVDILPGEIREKAPVSFQNNKRINTSFVITNDTISFKLADFVSSQPLTIDPELIWSTYFHDNSTSGGFTNTRPVWDSDGNMFAAMSTYNRTTFPTVNPGGSAYIQSTGGDNGLQLVIMKFNTSREIVWATYYASSQAARVAFSNQALAIDHDDNIYIVGELSFPSGSPSPAFPLYNPGGGAYYETEVGNGRNFILKFSSSGQRLWATIFNKISVGTFSSSLTLIGLAIDQDNRLVIAGYAYTSGSWSPIPLQTPGGSHYYQTSPPEQQVGTLHRFTPMGVLEWSTYISQGIASTYNRASAIAIDNNNNIFIGGAAGQVFGDPTPTPYTIVDPGGGAYQDGFNTGTNNGRKTALFKFNNLGALYWCTLYGGNSTGNPSATWQDIRDVQIASNGDVFFVGRVNTTDFPTYATGSAYLQSTLSTGSSWVTDGVLLQFTNNGVRKWATYYGGDGTNDGTDLLGMAIDGNDNIIVSGISRSNLFPTQNKVGSYYQSTMTADYSMVFLQFDANGERQWATYFGNQTFFSSGGLGLREGLCGAYSFVQFGVSHQDYATPTVDPGGGAYYQSLKEGTTGFTDIILEFSEGSPAGGIPGLWTWLGVVNNDWFEPCNWDKHTVPVDTSDVLIPGATPYQPTITGATGHCNTIEINTTNGAHLTIEQSAGGQLQVHQ